jgi:Rab guanine nucleotide exchange factor SEC2
MVAAAKHECEAVEKKNEQLRAQIKDTEMLLASQQEQLTQLKVVMQEMQASKDEAESRANTSTGPSSPAGPIKSNIPQFLNTQHLTPVTAGPGEISPAPSTSFSNLVKTVCRTDIPAYEDFRDLLNQSRSSKPPSRVSSGSYGGLGVIGLASLTANNSTNGSTASLGNPNQNSSPLGSPQSTAPHVPLKETRFYKRVFTEDIEPALRLDSAPSISWLTRRSVVSSIGDGTLVIEPMSQAGKKYTFPCSMCGERRKGKENPRTHRFRTSDSETAQRYTICTLCLDKMRSCCEIVGYLRMILDGHIRFGDEEEEHEAWEETVRLRERIFWARIGGGVVPCHGQVDTSEKRSPMVEDQHIVVLNEAETNGVAGSASVLDPKRTSINSALLSKIKVRTDATSSVYATDDDDHSHYGDQSDNEAAAQLNGDLTRTLEKQPGTVNETRSLSESKKTPFHQHSTTRRGSSESDTHLRSIPGAF